MDRYDASAGVFVAVAASALLMSAIAGPAAQAQAQAQAQQQQQQQQQQSSSTEEIAIGKKIAPVLLTIPVGVLPASVYYGSYIVNAVADCNGCHSNNEFAAGGNPFLGQPKQINQQCYLNGGQHFGPIVSRNITPNSSGNPAGLTYPQFVNVIRTGNDPKNPGALLQVMPWPAFQNMTDIALKGIYDYLSSIPPLPFGGSSPPCNPT